MTNKPAPTIDDRHGLGLRDGDEDDLVRGALTTFATGVSTNVNQFILDWIE